MKYAAVAWDIDGTLVDSEPLHLEALVAACRLFDVDISDLPNGTFIGLNLFSIWAALKVRFPPETDRSDLISAVNHYYGAHAQPRVAAMPGAVETVRALHEAGIPQIAVSNSNRVVVDANLNALGLKDVFTRSLSLDDVTCGKPDPLPYRMAVEYLQVPPSSIIAVEDSETGILSAKTAGLIAIGFSPNGNPVVGAIKTVSSLTEITDLFALFVPQEIASQAHRG
jgi:HAD superfamily hydrolase (TIGR01509 family)